MTEFHKVKCPYCFNTFSYNEALFRKESGERTVDKYLKKYSLSIGERAYEEKLFGYVDPADCRRYDLIFDGKYLVGVNDVSSNENIKLTQRICPYCHNNLGKNYGKKDVKLIAVVGIPNSGKTTYLAAVNNSLKANRNLIWTSLDYKINRTLEEITNLYRDNDNDARVASEYVLGPYYYNLKCNGENSKQYDTDIVFFDVPGEAYVSDRFNKGNVNSYIEAADGIIFIINSAEKLEAPSGDKKFVELPQILDIFKENDISTSKKIAIIFNKIDKVAKELDISNIEYYTSTKCDGAIDKSKILNTSDSIKAFFLRLSSQNQNDIQKQLSEYMEKISNTFSQNTVFATSLLSEQRKDIVDEDGNEKEIKTYKFNSSGSETPLLWMLSEIGSFPSVNIEKEKK